jgi:hypothetical protein
MNLKLMTLYRSRDSSAYNFFSLQQSALSTLKMYKFYLYISLCINFVLAMPIYPNLSQRAGDSCYTCLVPLTICYRLSLKGLKKARMYTTNTHITHTTDFGEDRILEESIEFDSDDEAGDEVFVDIERGLGIDNERYERSGIADSMMTVDFLAASTLEESNLLDKVNHL